MRKYVVLLVIVSVLIMTSSPVFASEQEDSLQLLSSLSEEECIECLEGLGCVIPEELFDYDNLGAFVMNIVKSVEENPDYPITNNYYVTKKYAEEIKKAVNLYYGRKSHANVSLRSTLELVDSISLTDTWESSFGYYNCYAYSIGTTSWPYPGYYSNRYFNVTQNVADMAISTAADLEALGNECVVYDVYYSDIVGLYLTHNIICLRTCTQPGKEDYHYMRLNGSWYHKPGSSAVLRYKYYPYIKYWTNEGLFQNGVFDGDRDYSSTIYYFAYRTTHTYVESYTGENYHSGSQHHYQHMFECSGCGDTYYTWVKVSCSGPPCSAYHPFALSEQIEPISH